MLFPGAQDEKSLNLRLESLERQLGVRGDGDTDERASRLEEALGLTPMRGWSKGEPLEARLRRIDEVAR